MGGRCVVIVSDASLRSASNRFGPARKIVRVIAAPDQRRIVGFMLRDTCPETRGQVGGLASTSPTTYAFKKIRTTLRKTILRMPRVYMLFVVQRLDRPTKLWKQRQMVCFVSGALDSASKGNGATEARGRGECSRSTVYRHPTLQVRDTYILRVHSPDTRLLSKKSYLDPFW